jgi:hypothetical protein
MRPRRLVRKNDSTFVREDETKSPSRPKTLLAAGPSVVKTDHRQEDT